MAEGRTLYALVVDDTRIDRYIGRKGFEKWYAQHGEKRGYTGLEVLEAATPSEALARIRESTVDIMLLDTLYRRIPEESYPSGNFITDVLEPLRAQGNNVPVVSWSSEPQFKEKAVNAGAAEFVLKGMCQEDLGVLVDAINRALTKP